MLHALHLIEELGPALAKCELFSRKGKLSGLAAAFDLQVAVTHVW